MVDFSEQQSIYQQIQDVLNKKTALLPDKTLLDFIKINFRKGKQFIHAVGGHLTPCYLFEPGVIISRAKTFKKIFQKHFSHTGFYFAMKSNNLPEISKTVLNYDYGLDVSSGVELQTALALGANDIIFSGPGKTLNELDLAIANSQKVVVLMDSFAEMKRLEKRAAIQSKKVRTGVRLTTEPNGLWRKFGILTQDLQQFIYEAKQLRHIQLQGLQFHTSWNMGPERQIAFIKELGKAISSLTPEDREIIKFIDIGGGYWPEQGEWLQPAGTPKGMLLNCLGLSQTPSYQSSQSPISESSTFATTTYISEPHTYNSDISSNRSAGFSYAYPHYINFSTPIDMFATDLSNAISEHIQCHVKCKICFEPGRWICNDSMHLILKVMDKKYDDLVITDGGTNAIGWERFETDYCPILNISRPAMTEKKCLITGSLCTPHDVWGYSYWGRDIQDGDLLMIPGQGAYTYSLRQYFIKSVPEVIIFP